MACHWSLYLCSSTWLIAYSSVTTHNFTSLSLCKPSCSCDNACEVSAAASSMCLCSCCILLVQLPDDNHSALEIQAFEGRTFAELVQDKLKSNATSIMLPSNLVLMHQAAM